MLGPRKPTDEQVIDNIRNGEQKMLVFLYKRNFESIKRYILQNSGNIADAEDILQDTLVVLWQKVQEDGFTLTAKLDTFLFSISKNLWLRQLRKHGRMSSYDFTEDNAIDMQDYNKPVEEENDKVAVLAQYMSKLGDTCKQLLSLFYFEQWDMEKIAEKMSFANADTAKAKKYQCKKKLEEMIKEHYTASDLL